MTDTAVMLGQVRLHWECIAKDIVRSHAMCHGDAVLEFAQSGERCEGLALQGRCGRCRPVPATRW